MQVIYQPAGRAKEYSPWAANLYRGCGHHCVYCYAPKALQMKRTEFDNPQPRADIIKKLLKDCIELRKHDLHYKILLCFSCDPYQQINDQYQLTREAIEILHFHGQNVIILTKGGYRASPDIPLLIPGDEFAVTLTCLDSIQSFVWEPKAAIPEERIETLRRAHELGIKTWVSLEPVIEPAESIEIIRQTHTFVDLFKVGLLNYHPRGKEIDWRKFLKECIAILKQYGCQYYIKKDLRRYSQ